jgi:hypothetical protein
MTIILDTFTRAYLECALWSNNDENGRPFAAIPMHIYWIFPTSKLGIIFGLLVITMVPGLW